MRDVKIRGNRNTVIESGGGGGGGGIETLAIAAIVVFVLAAVASAVAAALRAIEAIIMIIAYGLIGGAMITVGAGVCYLGWRWRRQIGRALSHLTPTDLVARSDPPLRVTSARHPALTNGGQGGVPRLHEDDIEALADALVRRAQ
ncbi:MAG TPA: hypothetical protein VEV45_20840 [Streptosporangiaceae bacterium]|nr:hypothetical protein [Streptosporangiaceae bacterium]